MGKGKSARMQRKPRADTQAWPWPIMQQQKKQASKHITTQSTICGRKSPVMVVLIVLFPFFFLSQPLHTHHCLSEKQGWVGCICPNRSSPHHPINPGIPHPNTQRVRKRRKARGRPDIHYTTLLPRWWMCGLCHPCRKQYRNPRDPRSRPRLLYNIQYMECALCAVRSCSDISITVHTCTAIIAGQTTRQGKRPSCDSAILPPVPPAPLRMYF